MRSFIVAVFILLANGSFAQPPQTDTASKNAVSKLAFITGHWKGEGWMLGPGNNKYTFSQSETVQFKLDSTALLIEGMGKSNGKIIHNAMAIVTLNPTDKNYNFQSFLATGRKGTYKAELTGDKLYWYPNENMRYIIYINDKGQWFETGETKRDGQWKLFFEMTLDKQ
jgi:hypothetical protein